MLYLNYLFLIFEWSACKLAGQAKCSFLYKQAFNLFFFFENIYESGKISSIFCLPQLRTYCRLPWRWKFLQHENFSETACSCKRECLISGNAGYSMVNLAWGHCRVTLLCKFNNYSSLKSRWIVAKSLPRHEAAR